MIKTKPKLIQRVYHFAEDDTKFAGDYHALQLWIDGVMVLSFRDHYHDHGDDIISGFLHGLAYAYGETFQIETVRHADSPL